MADAVTPADLPGFGNAWCGNEFGMAGSAVVPQIVSMPARLGRRMLRAYHVACAREEAQRRGFRVPLGAWLCERCRLVVWERHAFARHLRAHAAA